MNEDMLRAIAFKKAVLEVLKEKNNELLVEHREKSELSDKSQTVYDAYINNQLDLSAFKMDCVKANKIVIEIKYGSLNNMYINTLNERFSHVFKDKNSCFVLIISKQTERKLGENYLDSKAQIVIIDYRNLKNNENIHKLLNKFDEYIVEDNNILIDDHYPSFLKLESNLSVALGAGCSVDSNISDWNKLSEALGFELLYKIIDTKDSVYKNMFITKELNEKIFDSYDKNSALDVVYNSYINAGTTKADYYEAIKKVLYMSYDSPNDADTTLMNSINALIRRKNIKEVINYNFDSVLEQNYNSSYKSKVDEILDAKTQIGGCTIYHVHGYIPYDYDGKTEVKSFVFTDTDYFNSMKDLLNPSNQIQDRILKQYNIIFVGVSFTDQNLKEMLRKRKKDGYFSNEIYGFMKLPSFDKKGTQIQLIQNKYKLIQQTYFDTLGVKILWVNHFSEIPTKIDLI